MVVILQLQLVMIIITGDTNRLFCDHSKNWGGGSRPKSFPLDYVVGDLPLERYNISNI